MLANAATRKYQGPEPIRSDLREEGAEPRVTILAWPSSNSSMGLLPITEAKHRPGNNF